MSYDLIATSDYIDSKNAFLVKIDMSDFLIDYYQHRKDAAGDVTREQDEKLKDLIACFAIHLTARTAFESHAWTLSLVSEPPYSLFVTGSNGELDEAGVTRGFLVGNILTENLRHADTSGIHAQRTSRGQTFNSYVSCGSNDIAAMTESFYSQSEQSPIRIRISETSDTAIGLVALSGYDPEWFAGADLEKLAASSEAAGMTRMRSCRFTFQCDCSPEKLLPFFNTLTPDALEDLYGDDQELLITCPRCGKQFAIDRTMFHPPD